VTFSTRRVAAETGGAVSHQTVAVWARGGSVTPASRAAITAALARLERSARVEAIRREAGISALKNLATAMHYGRP
jgi:hypothetical protein